MVVQLTKEPGVETRRRDGLSLKIVRNRCCAEPTTTPRTSRDPNEKRTDVQAKGEDGRYVVEERRADEFAVKVIKRAVELTMAQRWVRLVPGRRGS